MSLRRTAPATEIHRRSSRASIDAWTSASSRWRRCWRRSRERGGRLFILGVGGSAGNASHAVNDFRKIAGIEAYAPTDNVSELTARTNDEGWATIFVEWLRVSRLKPEDADLRALGRRRQPGEERQPQPGHGAATTPRRSARRSSASSARTAATPRRWPTPA